jgi:hypothetical protein
MKNRSAQAAVALAFGAVASAQTVTFHRDVLPVLQRNCQTCHRPGEVAPMPFLTYEQTRPWAKSIKNAVLTKKMPPWYAGEHSTQFSNDRSLSAADRNTLIAWVDADAPAGNPADAPKPMQWAQGWSIGEPDQVFTTPAALAIPAKGTVEYQYVIVPTGFTEDRYVQMVEARPTDREHTHHIVAYIRPPQSKWLRDYPVGAAFEPKNAKEGGSGQKEFFIGYAPGSLPGRTKDGEARLVPAGSDIVFQLHYTTNGKAGEDWPRVGFVYAKQRPRTRIQTIAAANEDFAIPPGDANYKVEARFKVEQEMTMVNLFPHMHLRGKAFEYRITYPTGEKETILTVPNYDFNWQLTYDLAKPRVLPKGTVVECTAWFDNSKSNRANPDPTATVRQGEQSWDEMMIGFFDIAYPLDRQPAGRAKDREVAVNYPPQ